MVLWITPDGALEEKAAKEDGGSDERVSVK